MTSRFSGGLPCHSLSRRLKVQQHVGPVGPPCFYSSETHVCAINLRHRQCLQEVRSTRVQRNRKYRFTEQHAVVLQGVFLKKKTHGRPLSPLQIFISHWQSKQQSCFGTGHAASFRCESRELLQTDSVKSTLSLFSVTFPSEIFIHPFVLSWRCRWTLSS